MVCWCVIIVGAALFLYGANRYNALIGWSGLYLVIVGFLARIVTMVWQNLKKGDEG